MGNQGKTTADNLQVMSAGSGIEHLEHNLSNSETNLYQIWILPNKQNVQPRWEAKEFPQKPLENGDNLPILVSGRNEDRDKSALFIHSDSAIYGGLIKKDNTIKVNIKHQAYILASSGDLKINNIKIKKGDGAEITNEKTIEINAISDAEALIIDVEA